MKAQKLTNLVESSTLAEVRPLFKFTVFAPDWQPGDDCAFVSDDWHSVAKWLFQDDQILNIGERDYCKHLDGKYSEDQCMEFIWDNIEEYALEAGYKILKGKE